MNVEIFIKNKDGKFEALDMFDDENISIKFKLKDSSDLSKIFSTYSQGFTIPASGTNNRLLNYYFDSSVVRDSKRYIDAKIYVKKQLYKVGLISINDSKFKNNRITQYSINFFTSLTSLKDIFGDELLTETLAKGVVIPYIIEWSDGRAYFYSQNKAVNPSFDPDVIVPLVSNKRIWEYGTGGINDIVYTNTNVGVRQIQVDELSPAIPFSKIMTGIQQSSGLTFNSPLFNSDEYKKLYVWCNEKLELSEKKNIDFKTNLTYTNVPSGIVGSDYSTLDITNNILTIKMPSAIGASYNSVYTKVFPIIESVSDPLARYKIVAVNSLTNDIIYESEELSGDSGESNDRSIIFNMNNTMVLETTNISFYILTDRAFTYNIRIVNRTYFTFPVGGKLTMTSFSNSNLNSMVSISLNLFKQLPKIKTIDFLASFIKMFNISIIETNNIKEVNFIPRNTFYQEEVDYTDSIDIEEFSVKPTKLYKNINFKHKTSEYNSNKSFLKGSGREFGQELYTSNDDNIKDSIEIKTEFTIVPNRLINDTDINTFYGFGEEFEENATYGKLYKPNTKDFTVFYYNGSKPMRNYSPSGELIASLNFKIREVGAVSINKLETYNKVSIAYSDINDSTFINSLGFHKEVDVNTVNFVYDKNLFSNYYADEISQLYNPNTRLFEYNGYLTQKQVVEFDLKKEVIIERRRFSIEEADINIVTGKSKIVFQSRPPKPIATLPPAPLTFTVTLIPS